MSDRKYTLSATSPDRMMADMQKEFERLNVNLVQTHVTKLQEEQTVKRLVAERDQALGQLVHAQSRVKELEDQMLAASAKLRLEQEELQFRAKQQMDQLSEKLVALTQDRDAQSRELEQLHLQHNSDTRIKQLEEQRSEIAAQRMEIQEQMQQLVDQVNGSKKLLNSAKLLIQKTRESAAAERQAHDRMAHTLSDMREQFVHRMVSGTASSGQTDDLKREIEQLKQAVRQVSPGPDA